VCERKYNNIYNAKTRPVQAARQSLHGEQWRPYRPQPAVGQTTAAAPPLSYITAVVCMYINNIPIPKTEWCAARIVQRVCKCRRRSYYYLKKHKSNDGEKKSTGVSRLGGGVIVKYTPYRRRRRGDLPIDRARLIRRQQNGRGRATTAITVVDNPVGAVF